MSTQSRQPPAVFTEGPILRHVLIMTATGSIGLVAIFVVDFLSLLYVSWLNNPAFTAGVGYATQILFFGTSLNIGLSIAVSALVARALGAGNRERARELVSSGLILTFVISLIVSVLGFIWRGELISLLGARDLAHDVASEFLAFTLPANVLLGIGMTFSGVLRAVGDARRAMYVTLFGAVMTAVADPILIFGFGLGYKGAAISTIFSRLMFVIVGLWGAATKHDLVRTPHAQKVWGDTMPLAVIAVPAILTNIATPVANSYAMSVFSQFGDEVVAAFSIIDRVAPVAFGVLFALSSAVGPIIGQNYGAQLMGRVRRTLSDCFLTCAVYVLSVWLILWLMAPLVVRIFNAHGETQTLVEFFCTWGAAAWMFLGALFVANAAFNNLGFAMFSTMFNWGRATLGTIPFVTLGAHYWGPEGGLVGMLLGAAVFGMAAIITSFYMTKRIEVRFLQSQSQMQSKERMAS
jgi:putative MATE family efflux protein